VVANVLKSSKQTNMAKLINTTVYVSGYVGKMKVDQYIER